MLTHIGANTGDLVEINNWFIEAGSAEDWTKAARVRAAFYPEPVSVATGIPVFSLHNSGATVRTDFWAMLDQNDNSIAKSYAWPEDHWDWPILLPFKHGLKCGNMVLIGGQVAIDKNAKILYPGDIETQTRVSMDNLGRVLNEFSLSHADIVKLNTFYQGRDQNRNTADDLHSNVTVRGSYFNKPGPASTGIPFPYLSYDQMVIEIEAVAMTDSEI